MTKKRIIVIDYREINPEVHKSSVLPSLRDWLSDEPNPNEGDVARYLETAPAYSGVGKTVGDVLDPNAKVVLFPGTRTDGAYLWPSELPYYVRKYHLKLPPDFLERIASLNWRPPAKTAINWENMDEG